MHDKISSQGVKIIVISIISLVPAAIAVGFRIWARRIKGVTLALNDYAIVAALFFAISEGVTILAGVIVGKIGYHITSLSVGEIKSLSKDYLAAEPLWASSNACVKISILHLYIRLFPTRRFRWVVYSVMSITLIYWAAIVLRIFFFCRPFAYNWDKSIPGGSCLDVPASYLRVGGLSIVNLVLDVIVIILPLPILWNLNMATTKKVAISAVFGVGLITCVVSILRIVAVSRIKLADISYTLVDDAIWSALEPSLGIICACLPVIQPAVVKLLRCTGLAWSQGTGRSTVSWPGHHRRRTCHYENSRTSRLDRLPHEEYPLFASDLGTYNHVDTDLDRRQRRTSKLGFGLDSPNTQGTIQVTKAWEVQSNVRTQI